MWVPFRKGRVCESGCSACRIMSSAVMPQACAHMTTSQD